MTPLQPPWNFMDVLNNILLASLVLFIAGCCLAFILAVLGWDRRRPRVETRADREDRLASLGTVSWTMARLDVEQRERRED